MCENNIADSLVVFKFYVCIKMQKNIFFHFIVKTLYSYSVKQRAAALQPASFGLPLLFKQLSSHWEEKWDVAAGFDLGKPQKANKLFQLFICVVKRKNLLFHEWRFISSAKLGDESIKTEKQMYKW